MAKNTDNLFKHRFNAKNVTVHKKERVFKQYFAIDAYEVSYSRFDGTQSNVFRREVFERDANAVAVLAYDVKTDEIALIEQFRIGALNDTDSPWLIEIVAGMIDGDERPEISAIRELKEEIGVYITEDKLHRICEEYATPGGASEKTTVFVANADLSKLESHGGLDCEGEDIRVFKAPLTEAYRQIGLGRIKNAVTILAIQYLLIEKEKVKQIFR